MSAHASIHHPARSPTSGYPADLAAPLWCLLCAQARIRRTTAFAIWQPQTGRLPWRRGDRAGPVRLAPCRTIGIARAVRIGASARARLPLSGSGHADRIVGPRHGRCFAFGAATPRAANMRLLLGEGEVEPRKQKIDALEEPDGSDDVPLRVQAPGSLQRLVDTAQSGSQDGVTLGTLG